MLLHLFRHWFRIHFPVTPDGIAFANRMAHYESSEGRDVTPTMCLWCSEGWILHSTKAIKQGKL